MPQEPRYVIRPAEGTGERYFEIFDNKTRSTLGSFKERPDRDQQGAEVARRYAEELVERLNAEYEERLAAEAGRRAFLVALNAMPNAEVIRLQEQWTQGRSLYLPQPEPTP